jgi:branched-subunit amino acid transport protein
MTVWLTLLVAGAASYSFRFVPAVLVDRVGALARVEQISAYAVPVTFAAVAADAVVAARRTGSSLVAIAAGMPVLWILAWGAGR